MALAVSFPLLASRSAVKPLMAMVPCMGCLPALNAISVSGRWSSRLSAPAGKSLLFILIARGHWLDLIDSEPFMGRLGSPTLTIWLMGRGIIRWRLAPQHELLGRGDLTYIAHRILVRGGVPVKRLPASRRQMTCGRADKNR